MLRHHFAWSSRPPADARHGETCGWKYLRSVLIPAALVAALGSAAGLQPAPACAAGGQDIEIVRQTAAEALDVPEKRLAIASDGALFAAITALDAAGEVEIRVYRSDDGGTSWSLWGTRNDADPGDYNEDCDLAIAPGSPERLVVSYVNSSLLSGPTVRVSVAAVADAVPSWSFTNVRGLPASIYCRETRVSAAEVPGSPALVYVAWIEDSLPGTGFDKEIRFARSTDGGLSFGSPLVLSNVPDDRDLTSDIAADDGDRVHMAYANRDSTTAAVTYRRGTSQGATLADWGAPQFLGSVPMRGAGLIATAASPTDGGVLVAVDQWPALPPAAQDFGTWLYLSVDTGQTWPYAPRFLADLRWPDAAWGDEGPAVAGSNNSIGGDWLSRPMLGVAGPWTSESMIAGASARPALAADPSRGGRFGVVGQVSVEVGLPTPWFDAEWRGDPGYGVPELEPAFDAGDGVITSAPAIGDLDGDGDGEIVFTADSPHRVVRFDLETGVATSLEELPIPIISGATSSASAPALIDMEGDGADEVFVGLDNGKLLGLASDGAAVPGFPIVLGTGAPTWVSCFQVTKTAPGEIVAASARSVAVFGRGGLLQAGFPYTPPPAAGDVVGRVALGDVDADGFADLIAAYENGLVVLDHGGQLVAFLLQGAPGLSSGASLADLDGDGDLEIAVPRVDGTVALIHHNGVPFGPAWPFDTLTGEPAGQVAIGDFFGDGRREIIFAVRSGEVFAVDLDGNQPGGWSASTSARAGAAGEPVLQGIAPGVIGVALGGPVGNGHVWNASGHQAGWPRAFGGPIDHAAATGDLDDDGSVEIVVAAGDLLWVLDMGCTVPPSDNRWPMAGGKRTRNGCMDCDLDPATAVGDGNPALQAEADLRTGVPNPFNPSTSIGFSLARPAHVYLAVYDTAGRRVRLLVDEPHPAGAFTVRWDGTADDGRHLASGVYFCRMDVGSHRETRSMTLLR